MTIAERRAGKACLPPIVIDEVIDDPDSIRMLARGNAPYSLPGGRAPGLVWPTWRADWARDGEAQLDAAEPLLNHAGFVSAAAEMCGSDRVVPQAVYVNLTTPCIGQPVSHTDGPEFRGVDATNAELWLLQAMGASGLFEKERISVITAVAWFFAGERGYFRYWPRGRDAESVRHEAMWNTAVVGDNDFMHHKVERTGPAEMVKPPEMTTDALLDHVGDEWLLVQDGATLAHYRDDQVRLSLSWKAKVYDEDSNGDPITLDDVYQRMSAEIGGEFAAGSVEELGLEATRKQLVRRWPGFRPD